jgi:hypothetical protein
MSAFAVNSYHFHEGFLARLGQKEAAQKWIRLTSAKRVKLRMLKQQQANPVAQFAKLFCSDENSRAYVPREWAAHDGCQQGSETLARLERLRRQLRPRRSLRMGFAPQL